MDTKNSDLAFSLTPVWHGLGVDMEGEDSCNEVIETAGLDWRVETRPVYMSTNGKFTKVSGAKVIVRKNDNQELGVVGERYCPIQNRDAFSFFDSIVQSGRATYETAGSLQNGRRIWVLARLPGIVSVGPSDEVDKYILLTTSHDGSGTLRAEFTPMRALCETTLNVSLSSKDGVAVRHTENANKRLETAQAIIKSAERYYANFEKKSKLLFNTSLNEENTDIFIETLFPAKGKNGEVSARTFNTRQEIRDLCANGIGQDACRGTAWAAFNAVAEYVDHWRATRRSEGETVEEKRLQSSWFGSGSVLKQKAWDTVHTILKNSN